MPRHEPEVRRALHIEQIVQTVQISLTGEAGAVESVAQALVRAGLMRFTALKTTHDGICIFGIMGIVR